MAAPTPQRKASELIESINVMLASGVNQERLNEVVDEANKLKEIGCYNEAYTVLGMIAALRADLREVDRMFSAAIKCSGRDLWTVRNYASALNNLHRCGEAVKYVDEVVEHIPDDISLLYEAIKFHKEAFDVEGVRSLEAHCKALGTPFVDSKLELELNAIEDIMRTNSVTWDQLASRVELATDVVYESGLTQQFNRRLVKDGVIFYEIGIPDDIERVSRIENLINDRIAEESYSVVDDVLFITCSQHER
ncbi:MAG TPA: hypothetical protein VIY48_08860 [Candidatus Paceibacterota bacterium]